jgi:hypothetical protein
MRTRKDILWTWLLPDTTRSVDTREWMKHGGKWIIFDRMDKILHLAEGLSSYIDSGQIESAKYWSKDPSAICVYSLDRDKEKTWDILKMLGAGNKKAWEYDYAMDKNLKDPIVFIYSWTSKFRTILQSYGIVGTFCLVKDLLKPR